MKALNFKAFSFALSCIICIITLVSICYAAPPNVTIIKPSYSGSYYLKGSSYLFEAKVTNNPTSVKLYYGSNGDIFVGNMSYSGSGYYTYTWTPTSWVKPLHRSLSYGSSIWEIPRINVVANNASGTSSAYKTAYVTTANLGTYQYVDTSFYYVSPVNNSFRGVGTGLMNEVGYDGQYATYNCLAYAVDVTDRWLWPNEWIYIHPDQLAPYLIAYMKKGSYGGYSYSNRPGTVYSQSSSSVMLGTKVIAYKGPAGIHLAKVTEWNSSGYPTKVISKWGSGELIESLPNTFTPNNYSNAFYFFK